MRVRFDGDRVVLKFWIGLHGLADTDRKLHNPVWLLARCLFELFLGLIELVPDQINLVLIGINQHERKRRMNDSSKTLFVFGDRLSDGLDALVTVTNAL